jgi:hypothetical protein
MELDGTKFQMPNKLLNELKKYFKKNLCIGVHCNEKCCFC